jgi:alkylation response protein AidB-like acyl-CoA dehydrogenase
VYLERSDEQRFLCEAAHDALSRHDTLACARAALDGGAYLNLWPVAIQAGWPGLLSGEDVDGAGLGAYEAMLVLEACGGRLADARLIGHLSAVAALERAREQDDDLRRALAAGERRAALVCLQTGGQRSSGTVTLTGRAEHVLDAAGAEVLVVLAGGPGDPVLAVLESDAEGVVVARRVSYDATRALATVSFAQAPARVVATGPAPPDAMALAQALLAAESVGAAQACLSMARDYALERHAFGRAIGSFQAIKHRLVEIMRRVENARSLLAPAARAFDSVAGDFAVSAGAARVAAACALDYAAPENIFIHGGIGATWEHDAQLYYRRAELSRRLLGGAEEAAAELGRALLLAGAAHGENQLEVRA